MATTAIKVVKEGHAVRSKFMTVDTGSHLDLDVYHCDEEFKPIGNPRQGVDVRSEEEYHRELRKEAHSRGQFVPEESTDPEWNPA
jgi:hypothetical protein